MTDEINHAYDGGLYAELLRNRAFLDEAAAPAHWTAVNGAAIALDPAQPLNSVIGTSLRVEVTTKRAGGHWVATEVERRRAGSGGNHDD